MTADADIRRTIEECGRQCEIAAAVERAAVKLGDFELAAKAAECAEALSARAFEAVRRG